MDAARVRISLAVAIALAGAVTIAFAGSVTAGGPAVPLEPDLKTLKPPEPSLDLADRSNGKLVLRLSNTIGNAGTGPLELYPEPATASGGIDCTVGQYPDPHDRDANQRIWEDTNENGAWDEEADQVSEEPKVGCFEFHPQHGHWHFQDFSVYTLADVHTGETVAGPSRKIGFCILDGIHFDDDPDYPGVYPGGDGGCGFGGNPPEPPGTMGLSVGWADTYTYGLPGQKLLVTGVEKGIYCLVSRANPPGGSAQIIESNPDNNTRRRRIKLDPEKELAIPLDRGCPAP